MTGLANRNFRCHNASYVLTAQGRYRTDNLGDNGLATATRAEPTFLAQACF